MQLGYLPRMTMCTPRRSEIGPDLHPGVNWCCARGARRGGRLRLVHRPGGRLWRRRHRDDAGGRRCSPSSSSATSGAIRCGCASPPPAFSSPIDLMFFAATLLKIADGGWFPLAIGARRFRGHDHLAAGARAAARRSCAPPRCRSSRSSRACSPTPPQRVTGTAVFLTATPEVDAARAAAQPEAFRAAARAPGVPDGGVPRRAVGAVRGARAGREARRQLLARARALRLHEPARRDARARAVRRPRAGVRAYGDLVLPVAREDRAEVATWRDRMFAAMARNAGNVTDYFNIPNNCVVELGTRVEI